MKTRRVVLCLCAALLFFGFLSSASAIDKNVKGELTNWTWTNKCIADWLVPAFNKVYPNIKIDTVPMAFDETHDKIFAAIAAGSGAPDFATIVSDYVQKFIAQGGLVDMTDYINMHKGQFPKYKLEMDSDKNGRVFGVPFNSAPVGMWYRKDIFEKYNIKLPETYDEYIAAGRELKKHGVYIDSISVAAEAMDRSTHGEVGVHAFLTQQQSGSYFDANGNPTLDSKESKRAMALMNTLVKEGLAANVENGSPAYYQLMDDSKLATVMSAAWYINVLVNYIKEGSPAYGNWRFAALPAFDKGGSRASNLGGAELCIFKQTPKEKADLAMAFIDFTCTTQEGTKVHAQYGEFPSWIPSWTNPGVVNMTWPMTGDQKLNKVFAQIEPMVPAWKQPPRYTEVQKILQAAMNDIFVGDKTVDQGLADAQKEASQ
jgi:ABC-type glycerol-3-phosphate transport system substrate-binding protein